jgi:hypothetical protein
VQLVDFSDLEFLLILQDAPECKELMYELKCIGHEINASKPLSEASKSKLTNLLIMAIEGSQLIKYLGKSFSV